MNGAHKNPKLSSQSKYVTSPLQDTTSKHDRA